MTGQLPIFETGRLRLRGLQEGDEDFSNSTPIRLSCVTSRMEFLDCAKR